MTGVILSMALLGGISGCPDCTTSTAEALRAEGTVAGNSSHHRFIPSRHRLNLFQHRRPVRNTVGFLRQGMRRTVRFLFGGCSRR